MYNPLNMLLNSVCKYFVENCCIFIHKEPTPVFLPGESQGRGSLEGCCLWGHRVRHNWSDLAAAAYQEVQCLIVPCFSDQKTHWVIVPSNPNFVISLSSKGFVYWWLLPQSIISLEVTEWPFLKFYHSVYTYRLKYLR